MLRSIVAIFITVAAVCQAQTFKPDPGSPEFGCFDSDTGIDNHYNPPRHYCVQGSPYISRDDARFEYLRRELEALKAISTKLDTLTASNEKVANKIQQDLNDFSNYLRDAINKRFDEMPQEVNAAQMLKLRQDILKEVDARIAEALKAPPKK
jgi:predicted transcriptional regulator